MMAHHLLLLIKFYWNPAIFICLCLVSGSFHTVVTELNHLTEAKPKISTTGPLEIKFADICLLPISWHQATRIARFDKHYTDKIQAAGLLKLSRPANVRVVSLEY